MGNLVYKYGLFRPTEGLDVVREQLALVHAYRADLTFVERQRRILTVEILDAHGLKATRDEYRRTEALCGDAASALRAERAKTRSKKGVEEAMKLALATASLNRKRAASAFWAELKRVGKLPQVREELAALAQRAHQADLYYRAVHEAAYWGSRGLTDQSMDLIREEMDLFDGPFVNLPDVPEFGGTGNLGVQIQGGVSVDEMFVDGPPTGARRVRGDGPGSKSATLARFEKCEDRPNNRTPGSRRDRRERRVLRFRVSSTEKGAPIWATFPVILHRPLPPAARIKSVAVHLRKVGPREEWFCTVSIATPAGYRREPCGEGAVALNVGWRKIEDGAFRVGTVVSAATGDVEYVELDKSLVSSLVYHEKLRSIRDNTMEEARVAMAALLARGGDSIPSWVLAEPSIKTVGRWRSIDRLASIVKRWAREAGIEVHHADYLAWEAGAKPAEPALWELRDLAIWRYHDHHLWTWGVDQQKKSGRRRLDFYRNFAAVLARRYDTVVFDDFEITDVAERPETGADEGDPDAPRSNRHMTAPGELREVIVQAFLTRGGRTVELPAPNKTITCNACGLSEPWDKKPRIHHTCAGCGVTFDQDVNHCNNLLGGLRRIDNGEKIPNSEVKGGGGMTAAPAEGRFSRRKKKAEEAKAKKAAEDAAKKLPRSNDGDSMGASA